MSKQFFIWNFWGVLVLFSDSLAFSTSIASFFVPKDPNGSGNGPKQNFKKKLENLSKTRWGKRTQYFLPHTFLKHAIGRRLARVVGLSCVRFGLFLVAVAVRFLLLAVLRRNSSLLKAPREQRNRQRPTS